MLYRHSTMPSMQHAVDCNAEDGFLEAERRHIAMQKAVFWKPRDIILIFKELQDNIYKTYKAYKSYKPYKPIKMPISRLSLPHLAIMKSTKRMSTPMQRASVRSKKMSLDRLSQLPSKASPISSPLPLNMGEPLFPPVMSLLVRKQSCILPVVWS